MLNKNKVGRLTGSYFKNYETVGIETLLSM
jgi:hypothetical protein